ncbi:hypothetical protein [Nannocystis bainbridge]|uniref:Uncharacterized protein n=1 Tax=Nannocystis bainbridge TaxID=2995303 RepID=A0ABT5EAW7_9BACT|nr:hypothetical protein [Nannocystis bainbridge]MDC0722484.1 hypothetical protein [Nannocystis bainbridge]
MFAWALSWFAPAMLSAAPVSAASEHAACVELRDAGRAVEAAPRCRAAYDALGTESTEAALQDRASIVFDAHHTYQEAFQAGDDRSHLCAEAALLRHFLAFHERFIAADTHPGDRRDARKLLDAVEAQLGEHICVEQAPAADPKAVGEDGLLPIAPVLKRPPPTSRPLDTPPAAPPRSGVRRSLRLAGGVTLGVGLAASMATVAMLTYGELLQRRRDELLHQEFTPGHVPEEAQRASDRLLAEGRRANAIGASVGAFAAASVISGITLLAVDASRHRRTRRVAVRPSAWPNLGLRVALEF